ncbi:MAG: hypothetical protein GY795_49530 [Desulfobacterales bacterium]|nr:hypothetical protein [Desulfobacterales bacterium]
MTEAGFYITLSEPLIILMIMMIMMIMMNFDDATVVDISESVIRIIIIRIISGSDNEW